MQRKATTLLLIILSLGISKAYSSEAPVDQLVLLNWAEYMDPELLLEFERLHHIKVKEIHFESDDHRNALMSESGGKGYDLIVVNDPMISTYNKKGWLAPLPQPQPSNFKHIDDKWLNIEPTSRANTIPILWGTLGIVYRADLVTEPITRWSQFFKPDSVLSGKLAMINSSRPVVATALKSLGYPLNSTEPTQLKEAKKLLQQQQPFVNTYRYISLDETSSLLSGEVIASMMYSGDALAMQYMNKNIKYVLPEEGGNIWIDYMAVLNSSNKQKQAWQFINFLNTPKIAAQLSQYLYSASTNKTAQKFLPKDFLSNDTIYPSKAALDNSEYFCDISPRTLNKINSLFLTIALTHSQ